MSLFKICLDIFVKLNFAKMECSRLLNVEMAIAQFFLQNTQVTLTSSICTNIQFSLESAIMTFSCCVTKYDMSCVNNPTHSLPEMSSSANRSQLLDLIMEYNLYVKVAFLGSNLDATVNFMDGYANNFI